MAQNEHFSIYRTAMKLAVHLEHTDRGFPRYVKYTLGSKIRQKSQQLVGLVIRANGERDRKSALLDLRITLVHLGTMSLLRKGFLNKTTRQYAGY